MSEALLTDAVPTLDKSGRAVRDMFSGVASRYDLLNHLLSAGLDIVWRKKAAARLSLPPGSPVLDLCAGTGDQAVALRKRGAKVAAADFCVPMLALSRSKFGQLDAPRPAPLAADALALPFRADHFAAATVAFGLRNVADLDQALRELARTLRPGASLLVLEFAVPRIQPLKALYLFYFRQLLPFVGKLISARGSAYTYLPNSVLQFPQRQGFLDHMAASGFDDLGWTDLSGGIVCLYSGKVAS